MKLYKWLCRREKKSELVNKIALLQKKIYNKRRRNYDSFDDKDDFFNPNIPLVYHAQGQDIVRGMLRLPLCFFFVDKHVSFWRQPSSWENLKEGTYLK